MSSNKQNNFGRVAVLMGGTSAEREVSLVTGQNVYDALIRKGVDAIKVDVGPDIAENLGKLSVDRAFIALHGRGGEDGVIQALCELLEIPYTGSGVMASAVTLNKVVTKHVWISNNIPTPPFVVVDDKTNLDEVVAELGLPLCVKPICEGSSVGVSRVNTREDLPLAIAHAAKFYGGVMIEPWIIGRELTIGILNNATLPVIEIRTNDGFYDYEAKYEKDDTDYICPCELDKKTQDYVNDISLRAFNSVGCKDWGRIDFILDKNNKAWVLDLNTVPGMTDHSLVPKGARALGINFDDLVIKILEGTKTQ